ncbi:MAG: hypothetical protein FWF36_08895 [Propionibacteriaceae bacterium]|nr:hypothetical protein [Propionibacteriaceae bacterium]
MGLFSRASHRGHTDSEAGAVSLLVEPPATDSQGRRSMEDHRDYLLSMVEPLSPLGVSLVDAWGLALCEDIKADGDVPPTPVAETDGFAMCAADIAALPPGRRPILDLVTLDDDEPDDDARAFAMGETVAVRAGQALPAGADTVVSAFDALVGTEDIKVKVLPQEGDWVRPAGAEAADGEIVMAIGTRLDDRRSALLAAAGFDRVLARPRTRVAVVDVVDSSIMARPDDGRGRGVGMYMINAAARADDATTWRIEIDLAQPESSIERLGDELIRADLVLTVGGLTDDGLDPRLDELLREMGEIDVAEVAMRPGRQHGFGFIGDEETPVIMLPADPYALLVAYHAFARPMLRKLMGVEPYAHEAVLCYADHDFDAEAGTAQIVACKLIQDRDHYLASATVPQRHSQLPGLVAADALVVLPGDKARVYRGEALPAWLLSEPGIVA